MPIGGLLTLTITLPSSVLEERFLLVNLLSIGGIVVVDITTYEGFSDSDLETINICNKLICT